MCTRLLVGFAASDAPFGFVTLRDSAGSLFSSSHAPSGGATQDWAVVPGSIERAARELVFSTRKRPSAQRPCACCRRFRHSFRLASCVSRLNWIEGSLGTRAFICRLVLHWLVSRC